MGGHLGHPGRGGAGGRLVCAHRRPIGRVLRALAEPVHRMVIPYLLNRAG
ncbi:MAG: hypothetical protein JO016_15620 [Actinobacteria bacterium]|nr:hypothetical protein [Actinomycetota bacterium]